MTGERWARVWMDIARYADSAGLGSDPLRHTAWPYRDWVIRAFNSNMAFDRFTVEQLAGDLLPNATRDQIIAKARALMAGRYHVTGEDLRSLALPVLRHRVLTNYQAESDGKSVDELLREVINR